LKQQEVLRKWYNLLRKKIKDAVINEVSTDTYQPV